MVQIYIRLLRQRVITALNHACTRTRNQSEYLNQIGVGVRPDLTFKGHFSMLDYAKHLNRFVRRKEDWYIYSLLLYDQYFVFIYF